MAKGLNLTSTNIREFSGLVNDAGDDATLKILVEINDDTGAYVKSTNLNYRFSALPSQAKAHLNNFLRTMSKIINNDLVEENKETWTDL